MRNVIHSCLRAWGAAVVVGALAGFYVGAHILLRNSVGGSAGRAGMLLVLVVLYAALLSVPLGAALVVLARLARRLRPASSLAQLRASHLLEAGVLTVVALVLGRRIVDPLRALFDDGTGLRAVGATMLIVIAAVVVTRLTRSAIGQMVGYMGPRRAIFVMATAVLLAASGVVAFEPGTMLRSAKAGPEPRVPAMERADTVERAGPSRRVALLAFDGIDPEILQALVKRGDLPNFKALLGQAAYSELPTLALGLSPPIWTTIATGTRPAKHGIHDFFRREVAGTRFDLSALHDTPSGFATATLQSVALRSPFVEEEPVSPANRRVPAFWTLASKAGLKSCVIDWMATWPAEPINGVMISDRAFFWWNDGKLVHVVDDVDSGGLPLRLVSTRELDAANEDGFGLCSPMPQCLGLFGTRDPEKRVDVGDGVRFHLAENAFYRDVATRVFAQERCDLMVYYDHLPDFVNHVLKPAELDNLVRGSISSEGEQLALTMYRDADATLGALLAVIGPDAVVIVLSDHGVEIVEDFNGRQVSHSQGPPGVLFVRPSQGNRTAPLDGSATIYDIAPTVLALLGLPVPGYSDGKVLRPVTDVELGPQAMPRTIEVDLADYAADTQPAPLKSDRAVEEQARDRLRGLGYVE